MGFVARKTDCCSTGRDLECTGDSYDERERERDRVIFTSSLSYRITEFVVEEIWGGERIDEGDTRARSSERAREVQRIRRRRRREHNNVTSE